MPVVAKEALALEVPVVASDVAGLPEVVRPPWGALVAPGDADALAGALREILRLGAAERARRGAAGREHVARCCSVAGETARLAELMRSAARPRG
jgi:glycosyltransferase involved in cell wall biosynthesis